MTTEHAATVHTPAAPVSFWESKEMEVCCLNQSSQPLTEVCRTLSLFTFQDKNLDTTIHGVNAYQGTCIYFDHFTKSLPN